MAPRKKTKTMALDYEQQRQENIKRNREMIASILRQKSQLASLLSPPKPKKTLRKPTKPNLPPTKLRRSLRSQGLPPPDSTQIYTPTSPPSEEVPSDQFSFTDALVDSGSFQSLVEATCLSEERIGTGNIGKEVDFDLDVRVELDLKEENVRKVVGERITIVRFLPILSRSIVISGNKQGYLGFWDADVNIEDGEGDSDGVFVFSPHRSPVSGISVHPSSVRKVKSFDERTGEITDAWEMHEQRVNTIDFHLGNSNLIATSSTDGFVRIWDLRFIGKDQPKSIKEVAHNRAVHSAYFSPSGNGIVSTSMDDTVRIWSGPQYENLSIIEHNNQTGRWLSSFRAIWGWNDSYVFIGNMKRAIDVISTENNVATPLQSEYMTNIPCRFATHPYEEGRLACAGGGKLYLWTKM